jgi:transposase
MIGFILALRSIAACVLCPVLASAAFAQVANQQAPQVRDLLQLTQDIEDLNFRIKGRLSEMNSVAGLSAHGRLDPNVNLMAEEVARLNRLLVQRTAQLEQRYAEIRGAEMQAILQANAAQVAGDNSQRPTVTQFPQVAAKQWRKIELDGKQYYLVPVAEIDGPQARTPPQRTKVITPSQSRPNDR